MWLLLLLIHGALLSPSVSGPDTVCLSSVGLCMCFASPLVEVVVVVVVIKAWYSSKKSSREKV